MFLGRNPYGNGRLCRGRGVLRTDVCGAADTCGLKRINVRFGGRKKFMNILMIIGMFPGFMSLIAVYNILKGLGLNQSLMALIIVGAAGAAMGYHVSKGSTKAIPGA